MTRIIAGTAGGRRIAVPPKGTRPTSDRVRESLFSALASRLPNQSFAGTTVVDLYAGSGALGLEAASRGAEHVWLVEQARSAVSVIHANVAAVGLSGVSVMAMSVHSFVTAQLGNVGPIDVCFADPPYDVPASDIQDALAEISRQGKWGTDPIIIVERPARDPQCPIPDTFTVEQRRMGDTVLWYGH